MYTLLNFGSASLHQQVSARVVLRLARAVLIALATIAAACLAGGLADGQSPDFPAADRSAERGPNAQSRPSLLGTATGASGQSATVAPGGAGVAAVPGVGAAQVEDCSCRNLVGGFPCVGGCQACMRGVDCQTHCGAEASWSDMRPMDFNSYAHGGYAGPARLAHLSEYRLRPGDRLQVVFLITRRQHGGPYRLEVGDEVLIESVSDSELTRGTLENGLRIQPDGSITVRLIGQVHAAGLTVDALRKQLEVLYSNIYTEPKFDVTPVRTNRLAEDIRDAVGGQGGFNGQLIDILVAPDGKVRFPGLGEVSVQGFTLSEMKAEVNLRYSRTVVGLEIEPILSEQAPHFVHVLGEVATPSRVELTAPTTVLGAIASAGGSLPGSNLRQVVIFRRAEDWRLISTMLDLQGAVYGRSPTPADEIWLRDGDVVIVPAKPIVRYNWFVRQVFTEGIYGVIPFAGVSVNYGNVR